MQSKLLICSLALAACADIGVAQEKAPAKLPVGVVARLGTPLGQTLPVGEVFAVKYSADSKQIATTDGKSITIWEAESWRKVAQLEVKVPDDHKFGPHLYGLDFSLDGKQIAWASTSVVGVSDIATGKELWRVKGTNRVTYLPDGKHLIAGGGRFHMDIPPAILDAKTGKLIRELTVDSQRNYFLGELTLSADGKTAALNLQRKLGAGPTTFPLEIWDVTIGELIIRHETSPSGLHSPVAFSPDGKTMVCYQWREQPKGEHAVGHRLVFADPRSGKELHRFEVPGRYQWWNRFQYTPDGKQVIAFGNVFERKFFNYRSTIQLFDAASFKELRRIDGGLHADAQCVISPDGKRMIRFGETAPLHVWDLATLRVLPAYDGHRVPPTLLAFDASGKTLVSADPAHAVCVWDVPGLALKTKYELTKPNGLDLVADGKTALVSLTDGQMWRVDLANDNTQMVSNNSLWRMAPDGKQAIRRRWTPEGHETAEFLDVVSGEKSLTFSDNLGYIHALSFSRDSGLVLLACRPQILVGGRKGPADDTVFLWDLKNDKEIQKWTSSADVVALAPDGKTIAVGEKNRLRRFEADTGKELPALAGHHARVRTLLFAQSGDRLASQDESGRVLIWDVAAGKQLKRLDNVRPTIALSGDGRLLAAPAADGTILLWDVAEGK